MYFNTTNLKGQELLNAIANSNNQEDRVLFFFLSNPAQEYPPHEIKNNVLSSNPITSSRRAMTNLTKAGALVKTNNQVEGEHGKPVYTWTIDPSLVD